jgi:hypothetical protein
MPISRKKKQTRLTQKVKRAQRIVRRHIVRQRGGSSIFYFYNPFHYGDNILNLKFFYNISNILKEKNIKIQYYYDQNYIKNIDELERYIDKSIVSLHPLTETPSNAIILWMGNDIDSTTHNEIAKYYDKFYKKIVKILGLESMRIDTSLFQDEPYLNDIYNNLDPKFKDIDILIINSEPQSSQFDYNKEKMDALCIELAQNYKVVTTMEVNDTIPSTFKAGLKMQDIGAVSTHANYIIQVFTGPAVTLFNKQTKDHVKKWFILNNKDFKLDIDNVIMIHNINELYKIKI